jgi:hypothetical protein
MHAQFKAGTYTGNTAAQNISLGWVPDYVVIWNATDGDEKWEWFSGMASPSALKSANHDTAQHSLITSNSISSYAGSSTPGSEVAPGFTIGTALSESAKVFRYAAYRNLP